MKNHILSLVATLGALTGLAHAKTITVDNRVGSVAMFSTLQSAIDAAEAGDTILIAGSPINYGGVTISKKIHLLGPGYFLAENAIPGVTTNSAMVSGISFTSINTETLSTTSSGSSMRGLYATGAIFIGSQSNESAVSNILIDSCNLDSFGSAWGRVSLIRTYIRGSFSLNVSGSIARNCISLGEPRLRPGTSADQCTFILTSNSYSAGVISAAESSITNSIFVTSGSGITSANFASAAQGSVTYCMAVGGLSLSGNTTFLKPGVGNHPTIAFVSDVFASGKAHDQAYLLAPSSPARGIGLNGVDLGMFGGPSPYIISGVTPIPRITHFSTPSAATSSSGLRFEVRAKSF